MSNDNAPVPGDAPRWLRLLVYIMGIALVAGVIILIGGIAYKAANYTPGGSVTQAGPVTLSLGGAEIQHMALDGDRLALKMATQIIIVDTSTGQVISRFDLK